MMGQDKRTLPLFLADEYITVYSTEPGILHVEMDPTGRWAVTADLPVAEVRSLIKYLQDFLEGVE